MNLPNKLTIIRVILVPFFLLFLLIDAIPFNYLLAFAVFALASITDALDGHIARSRDLITDFGKFLDPLADKFMVIGAMLVILFKSMSDADASRVFCTVFFWGLLIVFFRELAVTSMRLVVSSSSGIVIAANLLGKIKTVSQITCVIACLLERILYGHIDALAGMKQYLPASVATTVIMAFFTLWSGIRYIKGYWKYMDPEK